MQIQLKDQAEQELIDAKDMLNIPEYFELMAGFKKLSQNPTEISEWYIFITYQSILQNFVSIRAIIHWTLILIVKSHYNY